MPQGLQIWDASGNLILDTSSHIGRVLGVATLTGGTNGSVTDANFSTGTPFWHLQPNATYPTKLPDITISGTTLNWNFQAGYTWSGMSFKLIYGVY